MHIQKHTEPLVSEMANDPDMTDLIELFLSELPKRVAVLQNAIQSADVATLSRIAHQLKGAAGGYGYPSITIAAARLESSAKAQSNIETLAVQVGEIADLCARAAISSRKA